MGGGNPSHFPWGVKMAEDFAPASFLLSYDDLTGTMQKMHVTTDNKIVLETTTNIDEIAERNRQAMNDVSRTDKLPDGMVRVASLPMQVLIDLRQKGILGDRMAFRKWLQSEEARPFRTHWVTS
jgi:hypothetical protein